MLIAFYLFAVAAVALATGVILQRNPIYCAMSLVGAFFCLGAVYVLIGAEFVAVIQVLVYAGAIMVLFLFVLMLLNVQDAARAPMKITAPRVLAAGVTVGLLAQITGLFMAVTKFGPPDKYTQEYIAEEGSIRVIGRLLYGEYVLPFEVISILLLVAIIGAVVIAKRRTN